MALPIQATPVLYGEASKRFNRLIKKNEKNRASPEYIAYIKDLAEKILKKSKL